MYPFQLDLLPRIAGGGLAGPGFKPPRVQPLRGGLPFQNGTVDPNTLESSAARRAVRNLRRRPLRLLIRAQNRIIEASATVAVEMPRSPRRSVVCDGANQQGGKMEHLIRICD
jgi:hypothetical protein